VLHNPLTRKHFPRFFIAPAAGELGIDHGVSDRGVSYPVLHKAEVCAGIEQVRGNRVLEGVEMPLALRDARELAVVLHEFIQSAAADGRVVAREEQRGDVAITLFERKFPPEPEGEMGYKVTQLKQFTLLLEFLFSGYSHPLGKQNTRESYLRCFQQLAR
jgi:hypothetical protein